MRQKHKVFFWLGIGDDQNAHHMNNYWTRLSMIATIIKAEVFGVCKIKLKGEANDTLIIHDNNS